MSWTAPPHTPYTWHDAPATDTPLDSAHLEAAENDLVAYTQSATQSLAAYVATNFGGSFNPTAVKTSAYTAAPGDFVPVDVSGGSVTVTLPAAPADKTRIGVKLVAVSGSNTVTVARGGSDVFNKTGGSTSLSLSLLFQGALLQYSSSVGVWYVQADDLPLGQLDSRYTQTANNLSDVASVATARGNLQAAQQLAATAVKTSAYTAAAGDYVPCDPTSAGFTVTLPSAPADKTRIGVKIVANASTPNTVTVSRGGSDVFNATGGSTSISLTAKFQGVLLQYTASTGVWYVQSLDAATSMPGGAASLDTTGKVPTSQLPSSVVTDSRAVALGDILVASAPGTFSRQAAGTNGQLFVADSTQPNGVKWTTTLTSTITINPSATGMGLVAVGNGSYAIAAQDGSGNNLVALEQIAPGGSDAGAALFFGTNGAGTGGLAWSVGIDTAAATPYRDFYIGKVQAGNSVNDVIYLNHQGTNPVTFGLGWVPGNSGYRVSVSADDNQLTMGGLGIRVNSSATGNPLAFISSSSGNPLVWFTPDAYWQANGAVNYRSQTVASAGTGNDRYVWFVSDAKSSAGNNYSWRYVDADNSFRLRDHTASLDLIGFEGSTGGNGSIRFLGSKIGFFSATPTSKPTVSGAKGSNAALGSLMSALSSLGLVTDSTTA